MKKTLMTLICLIICTFMTYKIQAAPKSTVNFYISSSDGGSTAYSIDGDYTTINYFEAGNNIVIISEEEIYGVYLEWRTAPGKFEVSYNNICENYGESGILHEFLDIQGGAKEIKLSFDNDVELANAYAYSEGNIPEDIQRWEKCEAADILIIATHIGDELLFFGGVISNFVDKGLDVQVAHFFDYTESDNLAEHEKLDALWKMGVKNYPVSGIFDDADYDSIELCEKAFDREMGEDWISNVIMTYKPVVCVTHAFNGEYFNNTHKYVADMVKNSVETLANNGQYDVEKTYFHLYEENPIKIGDEEALYDKMAEAYELHTTRVEYHYMNPGKINFRLADFGLYRTTVGNDTTSDMMENVMSHKEKAEMKEQNEKESIEAASREEQQRIEEASRKQEREEQEEKDRIENQKKQSKTVVIVVVASVAATFLITVVGFTIYNKGRKR